MKRFIETLEFDHVSVFTEKQATIKAIDEFFVKLYAACKEHKKKNSGKKFLFVVFYSGHGWNVKAL